MAAALIAMSIGLLVAVQPTGDLDLDVLFPRAGGASSVAQAPVRPTEDVSEATVVRWLVLVLAAVVAVPLAVPRRLLRAVLAASTALMALFVAVSILRLGVLYVPVLAFQVGALWVLYRREHSATLR